jgi:hypothetical protein
MTNQHKPTETGAIEAKLDAQGARARAEPDAGFESRITGAVMQAMRDEAPAPIRIQTRRVTWRALAAVAASVLMVGAGAVAWVSLRAPSPAVPEPDQMGARLAALEQDVDELLALTDLLDEHAAWRGAEVRSDVESLDESIGRTWDTLAPSVGGFTEESI